MTKYEEDLARLLANKVEFEANAARRMARYAEEDKQIADRRAVEEAGYQEGLRLQLEMEQSIRAKIDLIYSADPAKDTAALREKILRLEQQRAARIASP